jgi:glycosyltransferase involved in cell wall biosynthesis
MHPRILIRAVGDQRIASTRYRVLAHLEALNQAGFQVAIETRTTPRAGAFRTPRRLAELVSDVWFPLTADLLLVQRRTYPPLFARRLRRPGVPLVFDFDDALYLPPPSAKQGRESAARYRRNLEVTAAAADLVICGNQELASHVPHDRVEILPTPLDCQRFRPDVLPSATDLVVGWVGHSDNLPDLESLSESLREIATRHPGFRLVVVADRKPEIEGVPVEFRRWTLDAEVSCFADMTVGIMPLKDTPWARGKCAFKVLQYMALGIPTVASPVGMNCNVISHGHNGMLAKDRNNWIECIDRLLGDQNLRNEIARRGRQTVVERYSLDAVSPQLAKILQHVIEGGVRR